MGFCDDIEDINSICLTVVKNLMAKYGISYKDVGRCEVGTVCCSVCVCVCVCVVLVEILTGVGTVRGCG